MQQQRTKKVRRPAGPDPESEVLVATTTVTMENMVSVVVVEATTEATALTTPAEEAGVPLGEAATNTTAKARALFRSRRLSREPMLLTAIER